MVRTPDQEKGYPPYPEPRP